MNVKGSLLAILLVTGLPNVASAQSSDEIAIGTFDSRCVAAAYYRSADFMEDMNALKAEHGAAEEAGDTELALELEALGEEKQHLAHTQVFSTADIEEIIWLIWSELPGVAEEAAVDIIVSVWDIMYKEDSIRYVDVTDRLVSFFDPTQETLNLVEEMKGMPAIPGPLLPSDDH